MAQIRLNAKNFDPLKDPLVHIEHAIDCYGEDHGQDVWDETGEQMVLPPHYHLVELDTEGRRRCYGIGQDLPDAYQSAH